MQKRMVGGPIILKELSPRFCGLVSLINHNSLKKIRKPLEWRPPPESNRGTRICNPLHSHSARRPMNASAHVEALQRYRLVMCVGQAAVLT